MHCVHPYRIFPTGRLTDNGKKEVYFDDKCSNVITPRDLEKRFPDGKWIRPLTAYYEVPCGYCYGCRCDRAHVWSVRCAAEALQTDGGIFFATLTYSQIPPDGLPSKKDFSDFMKRLRRTQRKRIRFFACGEKGEKTSRPHCHVILFGLEKPRDMVKYDRIQYISESFEKVWSHGFAPLSEVIDIAAVGSYVAKYLLKDHGRSGCWIDSSNRPGLGSPFLEDNFPDGHIHFGDGRGKILSAGLPKHIRERLGVEVPDVVKAYARAKEDAHVGALGLDPLLFKDVEHVREVDSAVKEAHEIFRKSLG